MRRPHPPGRERTSSHPDPRDSASPYGVLAFLSWNHRWNRHHFPSDAAIRRAAELMQKAGVGFVRMDFLWSDLEPEPGQFDFARYDRLVKRVRSRGLCLLGILHYNPAWRSGSWNQAPDVERYLTYAMAVVRHFKTHVKYWEIWNEPDHPVYWQPQDDLTAYSELLRKVTPVIRKADPTARVVLGGLSQAFTANLRKIYEKAGRDAFDVVNIHPFVNPASANAVKDLKRICGEVRALMRERHDGHKALWITEIGCPGLKDPAHVPSWWLGANLSEEAQAAWVEKIYAAILRVPGVGKVFWAFLRDTDNHFQNGTDGFGLIHEDFSIKPAYRAYKRIAARPFSLQK